MQATFLEENYKNIEVDFLICSLFTLLSNTKLFQSLDLTNEVYLSINGENYLLIEQNKFDTLYTSLNKRYIRQLAYKLINPLLKETSSLTHNKQDKDTSATKSILFKKYLIKFSFLYKRYFFQKNENYNLVPETKEINTLATKALFLLVGV